MRNKSQDIDHLMCCQKEFFKRMEEEAEVNVPYNRSLENILTYETDYNAPIAAEELKEKISYLLDTLRSREKRVLIKYFGLNGTEPMSLRAIGAEESPKVTGQCILIVMNKALRKFRHPSRTKRVKEYLSDKYVKLKEDLPTPQHIVVEKPKLDRINCKLTDKNREAIYRAITTVGMNGSERWCFYNPNQYKH